MKIFISYSSKNRPLVESVASDLISTGHEVWFDRELSGGQSWWSEILRSVRNCDLFVFALTPTALDSFPCRLEYTYANALNKRILPILIESVNTSLLPPELSTIHFVDYRERDTNSILRLNRALNTLPESRPLPNPLPEEPEVPLSPLGKLNAQISAANLSFPEQTALVFDLKELLKAEETFDDAKLLLTRLYERKDLFARVAEEIKGILDSIAVSKPAVATAPKPAPPKASPKKNIDISSRVSPEEQPQGKRLRLPGMLVGAVVVVVLGVIGLTFAASRLGTPATSTATATRRVIATTRPAVTSAPKSTSTSRPNTAVANNTSVQTINTPSREIVVNTDGMLLSADISPNGKTIAVTTGKFSNGILAFIDGTSVTKVDLKAVGSIGNVRFAPDGKTLAIGSILYNATGQETQKFYSATGYAEFSKDGAFLLANSGTDTVSSPGIWNISTGKLIEKFPHDSLVLDATLSTNKNYIATGSADKMARIWDRSNGTVLREMAHTGTVQSVKFSPDGKYLLSCCGSSAIDKKVRVWEVATGKEIMSLSGTSGSTKAIYSPDGKYILTIGVELGLYDASTGTLIRKFDLNISSNYAVFSTDSSTIVAADIDGKIRIWDSKIGD